MNLHKSLIPGRRVALSLVALAAACGQTATSTTTETTTTETTTPLAPAPSSEDFIHKAAISDMFEIQASTLAATRAQNADIKAFARQMVTDHTATSAAVAAILTADNSLPRAPTALDQAHQDMLTELRNASAAEFDQKYVDQQTHAHQDALDLLNGYASGGDNAALRGFASETAPKVQHHLDMVRALDHTGADEPAPH